MANNQRPQFQRSLNNRPQMSTANEPKIQIRQFSPQNRRVVVRSQSPQQEDLGNPEGQRASGGI